MAPATIKGRIAEIDCAECRKSVANVRRHKDLDEILAKHTEHAIHSGKRPRVSEDTENLVSCPIIFRDISDEIPLRQEKIAKTPGSGKRLRKILYSPPSQADEESHKWQCPFVEVVIGELPLHDKLSMSQEVQVSSAVVDKALKTANCMALNFCAGDGGKYTEENNRPCVYGLAVGLTNFIGGNEQVRLETGPVRYYVKKIIGGEEGYVETSPPGEKARLEAEPPGKTLQHDDERSKKWKTDLLMYSRVDVGGKKVWVLRVLAEAKGEVATVDDLYQASLSGLRKLLKQHQNFEHTTRLYIEVWGNHKLMYGIQDIFGIPKTREELQQVYDEKARKFSLKYHCELPSKSAQEDFLVGVVYMSCEPRLMPAGDPMTVFTSVREKKVFVQGHLRILGSDAIFKGDDCNERILRNYERSRANRNSNPHAASMVDEHVEVFPAPYTVYREVPAATENTIKVFNETGEIFLEPRSCLASSSATGIASTTVSRAASSKEEVEKWVLRDIISFLKEVCRGGFHVEALGAVDGSLLLMMNVDELKEWLKGGGVGVLDRLQVAKWFQELK